MRTFHLSGTRKCSSRDVFNGRILPGFLLVSLLAILSCGMENDGANSTQTKKRSTTHVENSESVVESSVKTGEKKADRIVERGISDRKGTTVAVEDGSVMPEDVKSNSPEAVSQQLQGLPDLSLLQEPDFQRRAKLGHLVAKRRCILCHKVDGRGAVLQPPLVQVSVRRLERMKEFSDHLELRRQEDPHRYEAREEQFLAIDK